MSNLMNLAIMAALAKRLQEMQDRLSAVAKEQGPRGAQGDPGPQGPKGEPGAMGNIGPMPKHQWRGTSLRFEIAPGQWGKYTELKGEPGESRVIVTGGGSSPAPAPVGVPIRIAEGKQFAVPENTQMMYGYPITVDGELHVDGVLVEAI